jgi:hypothetical protein
MVISFPQTLRGDWAGKPPIHNEAGTSGIKGVTSGIAAALNFLRNARNLGKAKWVCPVGRGVNRMASPMLDAVQALDTALSAGRRDRRQRLLRAIRNQRVRSWIAVTSSASIAVGAALAWVAGDREACAILAMMACLCGFFAVMAMFAGSRKAARALHRDAEPE